MSQKTGHNIHLTTVEPPTYELLVPDVQRHVSQSSGDWTHHPVVVHPQQLHQDGQAFLFTDSSADVRCKLYM